MVALPLCCYNVKAFKLVEWVSLQTLLMAVASAKCASVISSIFFVVSSKLQCLHQCYSIFLISKLTVLASLHSTKDITKLKTCKMRVWVARQCLNLHLMIRSLWRTNVLWHCIYVMTPSPMGWINDAQIDKPWKPCSWIWGLFAGYRESGEILPKQIKSSLKVQILETLLFMTDVYTGRKWW